MIDLEVGQVWEHDGAVRTVDFVTPSGQIALCLTENAVVLTYSKYELNDRHTLKQPNQNPTDLKLDDPVLVRIEGGDWKRRHFKEYSRNGVYCWIDGKTSYTSETTRSWKQWKRPEDQ